MMHPALENSAILIKGYLLNQQTPPEIEKAIREIVTFFQYPKSDNHSLYRIDIPDENTMRGHGGAVENTPSARAVTEEGLKSPKPLAAERGNSEPKTRTMLPRRCKLDPAKHLAAIQAEHDTGAANNTIAIKYDVSDQTIVNFLRKYGTYNPQATGGRPKTVRKVDAPSPVRAYAEPQDALGEPLLTVSVSTVASPITFNPFPKPSRKKNSKIPEETSILKSVDLIDVRELHATGGAKAVVDYYGCTATEVSEFLDRHKNANVTKAKKPGWAIGAASNNHIVKPSHGGY